MPRPNFSLISGRGTFFGLGQFTFGRGSDAPILFATLTGCFFVAAALGGPDPDLISFALACCLVIGIPHGSLDVELILTAGRNQNLSRIEVTAIYVALLCCALFVWAISPAIAIAAFLGLSIIHFADDWNAEIGRPFSTAISASIIALPVVFHATELRLAFEALVSPACAGILVDLLILIAPVSALIALVGIGSMWRNGQQLSAIRGALALLAMLAVHPLIGFALFFCILHSPRHVVHAFALAKSRNVSQPKRIIFVITLLAMGLAALIFTFGSPPSTTQNFSRTVFVTLSILTVPHMFAPYLVELIARRKLRST